jgi:hypothetical protein
MHPRENELSSSLTQKPVTAKVESTCNGTASGPGSHLKIAHAWPDENHQPRTGPQWSADERKESHAASVRNTAGALTIYANSE